MGKTIGSASWKKYILRAKKRSREAKSKPLDQKKSQPNDNGNSK